MASSVDQRVLRWFGHLERIDKYRIARRALMAEVSGGRVQGRQRLDWIDDVKVALGSRGMTRWRLRDNETARSGETWRMCIDH